MGRSGVSVAGRFSVVISLREMNFRSRSERTTIGCEPFGFGGDLAPNVTGGIVRRGVLNPRLTAQTPPGFFLSRHYVGIHACRMQSHNLGRAGVFVGGCHPLRCQAFRGTIARNHPPS